MTPDEMALWQLTHRRATSLTPEMARAILGLYTAIRNVLVTDRVRQYLIAAIARNDVDAVLRMISGITNVDSPITLPVKEEIRRVTAREMIHRSRQIKRSGGSSSGSSGGSSGGAGSVIGGTMGIRFDLLHPRVLDAVRTMETRVLMGLGDEVRETVRQVVERGLVAGTSPRAIASEMRDVIGLGSAQADQVSNFEDALRGRNGRDWRDYLARDRRYDRTIERALREDGDGLAESRIRAMVDAYRRRRVALNAETVARTATLDAMKQGQHLAISDAVERGALPADSLVKTWRGVMDSRERPTHVAMEGETVPWDSPYSSGQMTPGDGEFNCRCLSFYTTRRPLGRADD